MSQATAVDGIAAAVSLRSEGRDEEARDLLLELRSQHPDDALINLQCAWVHDRLGLEKEAVPFYEKAIHLGLDGEHIRSALLGLGSTLRALGQYERAFETLSSGADQFPDDKAMQVFLALAMYNTGSAKEACETLLRLLIATTRDESIAAYQAALEIYAKDLDATW
ncbi:MAG: hypothetical protein DWQ20_07975 [Actinobacteria bacterium]|nr:MAG: hypothetical protein DWQ20_07975 [Actinomycetota bacterium]